MQATRIEVDPRRLGELVPVGALSPQAFGEIINAMVVERWTPGKRLFEQGDEDGDTLYLLTGEVDLTSADGERHIVTGGSEAGRYALASLKPRRYSAVALSEIDVARIDSRLLDRVVGWDQVVRDQGEGIEVAELGDAANAGWLLKLMDTELFRRLPTASLRPLLERLERVPVRAGDEIIRQGEAGDYFYVVLEGRCVVSRKSDRSANTVSLAALDSGAVFGEDALISGQPRNASVGMLTDGVLLRLAKHDFDALLAEPLVEKLSPKEASAKVKSGAGLIDVRLEDEYAHGTLKQAVNIPLYLLRLKADSLDPKRPYVVFCDTGSRSATAAFILGGKGFEAYVLDGGLGRYGVYS
jgi:CRP-like cAMP-binding protein